MVLPLIARSGAGEAFLGYHANHHSPQAVHPTCTHSRREYIRREYIPPNERLCRCGLDVETEEHFLLRCPLNTIERTELYMNCESCGTNLNFDEMSHAELMIMLLSNPMYVKYIANYVITCMHNRTM